MSLITDKPHLIRQSDLISREALSTPVTVIGAGAIGSSVCLWLAKMGMENITVWDPDVVGIENVSCQLYGEKDIGCAKVESLMDIVTALTVPPRLASKDGVGPSIRGVHSKWEPNPAATRGIVICAVDCMDTRREIFERIGQDHILVNWFIDARMGAEMALMYVMKPHDLKDQESYKKTLYSNEDAVQEACTAKATGYTSSLLSGWVVKAVKDIITGGKYPRITQWSIKDSAMQCYHKEG